MRHAYNKIKGKKSRKEKCKIKQLYGYFKQQIKEIA